jgi:hypothetical protein
MLGFRVTLPTGATSTVVTITFPGNVISYWKQQNGAWHPVAGATFKGHVVTLTLADNGPDDTNPTVGVIDDPGTAGVAAPPASPTNPGAPGSGSASSAAGSLVASPRFTG